MLSNINIYSNHSKYESINSSIGNGINKATLETEESLEFSVSYEEQKEKPMSEYAASLLSRLSHSDTLSEQERAMIISMVASFDKNDQLQNGSIYAMVSISIQIAERASTRGDYIAYKDIDISQIHQEYDNVKKLFEESPDKIEISGEVLIKNFIEKNSDIVTAEESQVFYDIEIKKNDSSSKYTYDSTGKTAIS